MLHCVKRLIKLNKLILLYFIISSSATVFFKLKQTHSYGLMQSVKQIALLFSLCEYSF